MSIFFQIPAITLLIYFLFSQLGSYRIENVEGILKYRFNYIPILFLILVFSLYCISSTRYTFGDSMTYKHSYENSIPSDLSLLPDYVRIYPKEPGYTIFLCLLKSLGLDYTGMFFVISLIQIGILFLIYRKYSSNVFISILLFVISTDYYSWCWNGIRQFLAVTICLCAAPFIFRKRYIIASVIFILASTIHKSALFMLPIIFVVGEEVFGLKTGIVVIATLFCIVFISSFTNILDTLLQDTQYKDVVTNYQTGSNFDDNGTNPLRVLVYSIPAIFALIGKRRIDMTKDQTLIVSANMSIVGSCIYLVSMFTSGIYFGRLPIYCTLYNYIILPWEIKHIFTKDSSKIVETLMFSLYAVFYIYQLFMAW